VRGCVKADVCRLKPPGACRKRDAARTPLAESSVRAKFFSHAKLSVKMKLSEQAKPFEQAKFYAVQNLLVAVQLIIENFRSRNRL